MTHNGINMGWFVSSKRILEPMTGIFIRYGKRMTCGSCEKNFFFQMQELSTSKLQLYVITFNKTMLLPSTNLFS